MRQLLCSSCRVHVRKDFPYCLHCGAPRRDLRKGTPVPPILVPLGGAVPEPVPVTDEFTIGRAPDNDLVVDDPSVSRHHARFSRDGSILRVEDLGSLNGTSVNGETLSAAASDVPDGAEVWLGDIAFRFDQPRPDELGSRTLHGAAHTTLGDAAPTGAAPNGEPLDIRPRPRSGWALKRVPGPETAWVLSTRAGAYLRLDEREAFVFQCVDGENTIRDILFAYAERFGELALPRIEKALRLFAAHELVDGLPEFGNRATGWRRVRGRIYAAMLRQEVSVSGLDARLTRLYRGLGWRFFTRTAVVAIWTVVVVGLVAFVLAQDDQRLLDVAGAGWVGALVIGVGYLTALVVHESAHALAVKSYGRSVRRGGFMLMMGMPFAFVDTSDMWFGTRWSRVVVSLSGPIATASLAGLAAMGAAWLPSDVASALCFQLAFGLYMNTVYNFNPVMPLDGYQALTDAFRVPRLRQEASAYFTHGLWRDLRARRRPGPKQIGLALYGLAAVVGGLLFLLLGLVAWRDRIGPFVDDHVPLPWNIVLVVAAVMVLTLPVWVRLGQRVKKLIARRPRVRAAGEATA